MSIVSIDPRVRPGSLADGSVAPSHEQQLQAAAEQFEALFLQQILKQMRRASDVLAEGNPMRSRELETLRDFYDQALAEHLAGQKQTGIADLLVQQLGSEGASAEDAMLAARSAPLPARRDLAMSAPVSPWPRTEAGVGRIAGAQAPGFSALVERVIAQESGGRSDAISPKGARGLMQLMPETAADMAAELGLAFDEKRLTDDAAYNRTLGSAYLDKMLNRYDGHPALALAAYNAGPARVDEWLAAHGDPRQGSISTREWIAAIPYAETRQYARNILNHLRPVQAAVPGAFNSPVQSVALTSSTAEHAAASAPSGGLAAFAQPVRFER